MGNVEQTPFAPCAAQISLPARTTFPRIRNPNNRDTKTMLHPVTSGRLMIVNDPAAGNGIGRSMLYDVMASAKPVKKPRRKYLIIKRLTMRATKETAAIESVSEMHSRPRDNAMAKFTPITYTAALFASATSCSAYEPNSMKNEDAANTIYGNIR